MKAYYVQEGEVLKEVLYIPLSENVAMNDMGRKVKNER